MCEFVYVFWQQGWCLSRHVRGRWFLLWHLHCHLVGGQDVLRWSLKGRVDGNLWHVPVVDVLVAVPHTVDQISLEDDQEGKENEHKEQQAAGVHRQEVILVGEIRQLVQIVFDPGQVGERADGHQAAQSKVKQLVAEKRNEPAVTMLRTETDGDKEV